MVMIELQILLFREIQAAIVGYVTKTLLITYIKYNQWLCILTGVFFAALYGYGKGPPSQKV